MNKIKWNKKVKCPVKWFGKALGKDIEVSEKAVFHPVYGWVCDCGQWMKGEDPLHSNVFYGKRLHFIFVKK